ncbi:ADCY3 family protein [Megaselia abdita]
MGTTQPDVNHESSDVNNKLAMDKKEDHKDSLFDQSMFSEVTAQSGTVDGIDDEQIHQFGYDLEVTIPKTILDEIFYSYFLKQRSFGLIWFLISSIHFDSYCVWLQYANGWTAFGCAIILLSSNLSMIAILLYSRYKQNRYLKTIWKISPYIAWWISVSQIGSFYFLNSKKVNPLEVLSWGIFINFQIYITLPIPLLWEGVGLGLINGVIFTTFNFLMCNDMEPSYRARAIITNMTMGVTAAIIGIVHSILNELKQRIAFLEAKKSLEVNMKIEEHSQVQERLLLSVLPKYVADKVRMDMGVTKSDQFKKIYMSRHENVSILYADIVGFTAISSTYSAQDLVKMLNELFARFDKLADKYEQLRIKILGDCYYCISGAPDEKLDHAILSCHMGLSMVHAIKYLQNKTNSPVDMRVGIHTGAILAGILGQRQWQFDVYSKDVELANKMESSGMAGRVHISEKTRLCLGDQFAVEPAYGEKKEPALRLAGLTTYFIIKVLVPFEERNRSELQEYLTINMKSNIEEGFNDMIEEDSLSSMDNAKPQLDSSSKLTEFIERFKKELNELTQDELHFRQLSQKTNMFLTFINKEVEKAYHKNREKISSLTLLPIAIINIVESACSFYIFNSNKGLILQIGPSMIIMAVTIIFMAESCGVVSSCLRGMSKRVNDNEWLRHGIALTVILITIITFINEMESYYNELISNGSQDDGIEILSFQSFYTNLGILLLMSVAVISHLTHIVKIGIMVGYLCIYSVILYVNIQHKDVAALTAEQSIRSQSFNLNMIILLSAVTLVLCYLSRYMDRDDRVIFMWKSEVCEQRKTYADMRKKNQALVYNVLPVNVAEHFMKNIKRSHLYLYSQSYSEVGVLFASMPNFSDFYSEETVNNQGLECLRVLNEVISDYDAKTFEEQGRQNSNKYTLFILY